MGIHKEDEEWAIFHVMEGMGRKTKRENKVINTTVKEKMEKRSCFGQNTVLVIKKGVSTVSHFNSVPVNSFMNQNEVLIMNQRVNVTSIQSF